MRAMGRDRMRPLVLGSASPRRREILAALRVPCVVRAVPIDESAVSTETPDAYLERIVERKLAAVVASTETSPDERVLVADTSVVLAGRILGKPANQRHAASMLRELSGRTHTVMTRFAIGQGRCVMHAETVCTEVAFRVVDEDEVLAYAASGEGLDKAGGYAVQGGASAFVSTICGSYSNVVGLPACQFIVALRRLDRTQAPPGERV